MRLGPAILHASLLGVAASWVVPGSPPDVHRRHRALHRTGAPVACAPFRSDDEFDYFRRSKELTIELTKPLGAVLEAASAGGVQVVDVVEGGSAFETGLLKKRDRLVDISGADVSEASFDEVTPPRGGPSLSPAHAPFSQPQHPSPCCPAGDGGPGGCGRRAQPRHLQDNDRQGQAGGGGPAAGLKAGGAAWLRPVLADGTRTLERSPAHSRVPLAARGRSRLSPSISLGAGSTAAQPGTARGWKEAGAISACGDSPGKPEAGRKGTDARSGPGGQVGRGTHRTC